METAGNELAPTRIAAVGDIHVRESDRGKWTGFFKTISEQADVLLLCGDLTDTGKAAEAEVLAEELRDCSIPVVGVLGNHDYDKEQQEDIIKALSSNHVHILNGNSIIIGNVGIAGVKGFGGGFDQGMLSMFGEQAMKAFVQEAVDESLKLDGALARLASENHHIKKVVVMHYAPISATIIGEPEQIFPFMGSSRLAEPLDRRNVVAAFHGHAHNGKVAGETASGVRVFNVSKPLLVQEGYELPCFFLEV